MLRFIVAVLTLMILLKISRDNAYIGFAILLFLILAFMTYTIDSVDEDDIRSERELLKTPEGRRKYYEIINSQ